MREAGKVLMQAFYSSLNGNLSYDDMNIPVFDNKVEGNPRIYVLLLTSNDNNVSNKTKFTVEKNLNVEIYNMRNSTVQGEVLEAISDQILSIIIPTVQMIGFVLPSPFSLTYCRLESASNEEVAKVAESKFLHAKRLIFKSRVTQ